VGDALALPKIVQEVKHGDRGSFSKEETQKQNTNYDERGRRSPLGTD
jgi:hypothetical protein